MIFGFAVCICVAIAICLCVNSLNVFMFLYGFLIHIHLPRSSCIYAPKYKQSWPIHGLMNFLYKADVILFVDSFYLRVQISVAFQFSTSQVPC
jgi:hypothetical protein